MTISSEPKVRANIPQSIVRSIPETKKKSEFVYSEIKRTFTKEILSV